MCFGGDFFFNSLIGGCLLNRTETLPRRNNELRARCSPIGRFADGTRRLAARILSVSDWLFLASPRKDPKQTGRETFTHISTSALGRAAGGDTGIRDSPFTQLHGIVFCSTWTPVQEGAPVLNYPVVCVLLLKAEETIW